MKSSPKDEKFTPLKYVKMVRKVIGSIELDPASSEFANTRIDAHNIFTIEYSGLSHTWFGNVFCNPPYSRGHLNAFTKKIDFEFQNGNFKNGIYLTPNATDSKWFQILSNYPICLTNHRISFVVYDKFSKRFNFEPNPENGSCFTLFTRDKLIEDIFLDEFSSIGNIFYKAKERKVK